MDLEKKIPGSALERLTGNRKFVISKEGVIHFGKEGEHTHIAIIKRLKIELGKPMLNEGDFAGGGNADCDKRLIHGWSKVCGPYSKKQVEAALEQQGFQGWRVEESGE